MVLSVATKYMIRHLPHFFWINHYSSRLVRKLGVIFHCLFRLMLTVFAGPFFCIGSTALDIFLLLPPSSLCWRLYCLYLTISVDLPGCLLSKLQRAQSNAARIVFCKCKTDHVTPLLLTCTGCQLRLASNSRSPYFAIVFFFFSWSCLSLSEFMAPYKPGRFALSMSVFLLSHILDQGCLRPMGHIQPTHFNKLVSVSVTDFFLTWWGC